MANEAKSPKMEEQRVQIKYVGPAGIRRLSAADLRTLGVRDAEVGLELARNSSKTVSADVARAIGENLYRLPGFKVPGYPKESEK